MNLISGIARNITKIRNRTDAGSSGDAAGRRYDGYDRIWVQKGCAFVRVHDVEKNKRAIQMTKAIMRGHEV